MNPLKRRAEVSLWVVSTGRKPINLSRAKVADILTASADLIRALLDIGEQGKKEGYALAYNLASCYMRLELKKAKVPISTLAEHYGGGRRIGVVCIKKTLNFTQERKTISKPMEQVREIDGVNIRLLDGKKHSQDSYFENDIHFFTPYGVESISVYELQTTGCTVARKDAGKLRANLNEFLFANAPQIENLLSAEVFKKFFVRSKN